MTKADDIRARALWLVGQEYEWGDEPWYLAATPRNPYDTDCSGLIYGVFRKCGIPWRTSAVWPRLTAAGYQGASTPVKPPYRVGDVICFGAPAYHIALYVGLNETVEARGERWGVVRYRLDDPVNGVFKRGGKVRRFDWLQLGELTEDDMTDPQDQLLKLIRLSAVARSFDADLLITAIKGEDVTAIRARQKAAIEAERARLGLPKGLMV